MACLRIGIGAVAGIVILIMARTILGNEIGKQLADLSRETVAAAGLIAGFTERLVPSLLKGTANRWSLRQGHLCRLHSNKKNEKSLIEKPQRLDGIC
jgi:uncharacterized protein involved in response to NO